MTRDTSQLSPHKRCFTFCGDACDCGAASFVAAIQVDDEPAITGPCPYCSGSCRVKIDTFAARLLHLRQAKGVSLRQIPGVSSALYSQMETGRISNPGADKLIAIADFFDVSVDWLLGRAVKS